MTPFTAPNLADLAKLLASAQTDVVIVGGIAMTLRGADYLTYDFDVCYRRDPQTIAAVCGVLAPISPMLRAAFFDYHNVLLTEDVALTTDLGRVDLMGALSGIGDYEQVAQHATLLEVGGFGVQVLTLEGLIRAKEAVLRDKDKLHLATLKALKALRDEQGPA